MSTTRFPPLQADNDRIALIDGEGRVTYGALNDHTNRLATGLLDGKKDMEEERIAFFLPASTDYVAVMHGVWRAGGIAVPLNVGSTIAELEHYLRCARVTRLVAHAEHHSMLGELCVNLAIRLLQPSELMADNAASLPDVPDNRRAMMVFTSGTTSKPKGVVTTHGNIRAQVTVLLDAWGWSHSDSIPLFLPLHHVHGIINVLSCALWAGATVHLFPRFDASAIAAHVAAGDYSVFMAVPTIYVKLLDHLDSLDEGAVQAVCDGFAAMRLNVSGSAACPVPLFEQWQARTGQVLLERYGMTEIGMALSNPYHGERRAGHVGQPLPGVEVRLYGEDERPIVEEGQPGEIRVKGPNVFLEYWDNEQSTRDSFRDGWFCTGDMAVVEQDSYRIMGRTSIDIIKSGGYKISALEIEAVLLAHPAVAEIAVIGVEDETWGEMVAAFIVPRQGRKAEAGEIMAWSAEQLSSYKVPRLIRFVDTLPRNAMGKVTKPDLKMLLSAPPAVRST
ncbi:acyl-CoA synthetase [Rhizorhapis sp. SPR117]|uniref:acyl-CoA synthetase n=1 Tax=Rhizorhapis sp. SPR117 TaxID=2912611 RepID=UPI001F300712|nr:acyl-CoA synthetase [Rhizorhapis sp. SPR117]